MERQMYYDKPTQVMFYDFDGGGSYNAGIAYCDDIICGCCGGVFSIEEIYEFADSDSLMNPIIRMDWVDISDEIRGDLSSPIPIFKMEDDWEKLSEDIFH